MMWIGGRHTLYNRNERGWSSSAWAAAGLGSVPSATPYSPQSLLRRAGRSVAAGAFILVVLLFAPGHPQAQFGTQPMRIIFPFGAGGSGDTVARLVAERLSAELGQSVIVENRTGAAGMLGVQAVKAASPDGTTLLLTPFTLMVIYPHIYRSLKYDPAADFTPVSQVVSFEFSIAVSKNLPVKNIAEMIAWIKANPNKGNFGTPGAGTLPHFFGLAFARAAGIDLQNVPYRGTAAAAAALLGEQIPFAIVTTSDVLEHHKAGNLRIIATLDAKRSPYVPDVPTLKEAGFDLSGNGWFALYAPAGTPPDTANRISQIVQDLAKSDTFKERMSALGLQAVGTTPDELSRIQNGEAAKWGPIVKESGFQPTN